MQTDYSDINNLFAYIKKMAGQTITANYEKYISNSESQDSCTSTNTNENDMLRSSSPTETQSTNESTEESGEITIKNESNTDTQSTIEGGNSIENSSDESSESQELMQSVPGTDQPTTNTHGWLIICVLGLDNTTPRFKIMQHTPMRKLMQQYCDLTGHPRETIRFRYDGLAINDSDTPASLNLVNYDVIETYRQQIGGSNEAGPTKFNPQTSRLTLTGHPRNHQTYCACHRPPVLRSDSLKARYERMRSTNLTNQQLFEPTLYNIQQQTSYPNIQQFLSRDQFTIAIEGNIAAGKTTLLDHLATTNKVLSLREPLEKWRDLENINLLEKLYQQPKKWAYPFQNYAMQTMVRHHLHPAPQKIIERSLDSTFHVFLKTHQVHDHIQPTHARLLENWYSIVAAHLPIKLDLIIYLKLSPEIALERIRQRNRYEERHIHLPYIQTLQKMYDRWLLQNTDHKVIVVDAAQTMDQILAEINEKIQNWSSLENTKLYLSDEKAKFEIVKFSVPCKLSNPKVHRSKENGTKIRWYVPPSARKSNRTDQSTPTTLQEIIWQR